MLRSSARTRGSGSMCNFPLNHHMTVVILSVGWKSRSSHGLYILLIGNLLYLCLVRQQQWGKTWKDVKEAYLVKSRPFPGEMQ